MKRNLSISVDLSKMKNRRAKHGEHYVPTDVEHIANMITHGEDFAPAGAISTFTTMFSNVVCYSRHENSYLQIWVFPSLYGIKKMTENATSNKEVVTLMIYGMALFFLFTTSTLYHCLSFAGAKGTLRHFFHLGDRAVIYIFIAASYTPWLVLKDFGGVAEFFMWVVWIGCILGIIFQFLFHARYKSLEVVFYLVVGICPAYAVTHMTDPAGVHELAIGGVIYVSGVVFFKLDGVVPFAHAIWHIFVGLGALSHFYAINKYLVGIHGARNSLNDIDQVF